VAGSAFDASKNLQNPISMARVSATSWLRLEAKAALAGRLIRAVSLALDENGVCGRKRTVKIVHLPMWPLGIFYG
jgi:hypothetical protein